MLAKGKLPDRDEYAVQMAAGAETVSPCAAGGIAACESASGRVEPREGGNFVLTDFKIMIESTGSEPKELKLTGAKSTFNQGGLDVKQAIDGNAGSGWGVWPGQQGVKQAHTAIFTLAEPVVEKAGTKLTVLMKFNHSAKSM